MGTERQKTILELLSERHTEWIRMASTIHPNKKSNLPRDISNELVQDMYMKMYKYIDDPEKIMYNETEVNTMYIWIVLRNLYMDRLNYEYKQHTSNVNIDDEDTNRELIEIPKSDLNLEYEVRLSKINKRILDEVDSWHHYDKKLFKLVIFDRISMRKLSKATGISVTSIFNTIKICKLKLKSKFHREYDELFN